MGFGPSTNICYTDVKPADGTNVVTVSDAPGVDNPPYFVKGLTPAVTSFVVQNDASYSDYLIYQPPICTNAVVLPDNSTMVPIFVPIVCTKWESHGACSYSYQTLMWNHVAPSILPQVDSDVETTPINFPTW
ncbi:MAG TPA: hypothetical protein VGL56_01650 [Fimbriimonadaceae bacterium]